MTGGKKKLSIFFVVIFLCSSIDSSIFNSSFRINRK